MMEVALAVVVIFNFVLCGLLWAFNNDLKRVEDEVTQLKVWINQGL